jgi:hypothetical protein
VLSDTTGGASEHDAFWIIVRSYHRLDRHAQGREQESSHHRDTGAARKLGQFLANKGLIVAPDEVNKAYVEDPIAMWFRPPRPGTPIPAHPRRRMKQAIVPEKLVLVVPDALMGKVLKT